MPYRWTSRAAAGAPDACAALPAIPRAARPTGPCPVAELHLWPHRSLPRRGFVAFIGATGALMCLPLVAMLGTPVLWGLLPFLLGTLCAVWWAIECSYRSGLVTEELKLWPDRVTLTRHHPRTGSREWDANPHWARVRLYEREGPVAGYVTLRGAGREVEIGAFLSEPERKALYHDLRQRLRSLSEPVPVRPDTTAPVRPATAAPVRPASAAPAGPATAPPARSDTAAQARPDTAAQARPDTAAQARPDTAAQARPDTAAPARPPSG